MLGRKKLSKEQVADWKDEFRFGIFDKSGFVDNMHLSNSKREFESLKIPEGTKPFRFPTEAGFIPVYLQGNGTISEKYSRGNNWICAELIYTNFELSGSLSGKIDEYFHRVGDIKNSLDEEKFSLKANIFIVALVLFAGMAVGYVIGSRVF